MNSYEETTTAKEHMAWCKKRALEYLNRESKWYSTTNAVSSMLSDIRKHPETAKLMNNPVIAGLGLLALNGHREAEKFITGFADF